MPSTLITKYGSGAPLASDLVRGELAVDTENGRLYTENSLGAVVEIGLNPGGNLDVTGTVTADGLTVQKSGDIAQFTNGTRSAYLSADSGGFSLFTGAGQTGNGFYANEAGTYAAIYTNSSEKVRIDSSGNVGLKNSSPSSYSGDGADLVIGTTSGDNGLSIISGTSGTGNIYFGDVEETGTGSRRGQIVYDHVSDHMRFATAATERMRIDSSGNVGIGTTSPATLLHVKSTGSATATIEAAGGGDAILDIKAAEVSGGESIIRFSDSVSGVGFITYAQNDGGSDFMRFGTASTERMRIDSTGNVGIGTESPEKRLHIFDSTQANQTIRFGNPSATPLAEINYDSSGFEHLYISVKGTTTGYGNIVFSTGATPSERVRIDSSGNLYCSGGSGGTILTLTASSGTTGGDIGRIRFGNNNIDSNLVNIVAFQDGATDSGGLKFETQPTAGATTERMRIDSSGNLLVGTTTAGGVGTTIYEPSGIGRIDLNKSFSGAATAMGFYYNGSQVGSITYTDTSTAYNTSSDYRLKENIVAISGATERLKQLKPSRFNFIADPDTTVDGFLAHEVQDIVPEAITGTKDAVDAEGNPEYQGIDQSKLVPLLVATIQELEARIAALEGAN